MEQAASYGTLLFVLRSDSTSERRSHNCTLHQDFSYKEHLAAPCIISSHESDGDLADKWDSLTSESAGVDTSEETKIIMDKPNKIQHEFSIDEQKEVLPQPIKLYKRRFFILFIFSMIAFMQYGCWNTFGPISTTCMEVFGWTEQEIALMASFDPITYIFTIYLFSWLVDVKGMRKALLLTSFFAVLGTGLRCVTSNNDYATWTMALGQFFNGLAGPVTQAGPPVLSSLWFPPNERTTATALASLTGSMGIAVSYVIGAVIFKEAPIGRHEKSSRQKEEMNNLTANMLQPRTNNKLSAFEETYIFRKSFNHSKNGAELLSLKERTSSSSNVFERVERERKMLVESHKSSIMTLLYIEFGINLFLFICVIVYFPDKPPLPPSLSGYRKREKFTNGLKLLLRNRQFWVLAIIYGLTTGVYSGWGAVLNVNVSTFGISQDTAGWIGFYAIFAGVAGGVLLARFADTFGKYMKLLLLILLCGATGFFAWFTLLCLHIIQYSKVSLYISAIFGGYFISGTIPLFYELTIEQTYPVAEGITTGVLTLINNTVTVVFLVILIVPNIGTLWMNWVLAGSCALCIPVLLLLKVDYKRFDIDSRDGTTTSDNDVVLENGSVVNTKLFDQEMNNNKRPMV